MISLEEVLDRLDHSREQLLIAIENLSDEALLEKNTLGIWSAADILILITAWESELVTGLMRIKQGKSPDNLLAALANREAYEAKCLAEKAQNTAPDLDGIFDDFQGVRFQLEEWLEQFPDKDLVNPQRYKWLNGQSVWMLVQAISVTNDLRFAPVLKEFADLWLADEAEDGVPDAGATDAPIIPLTAVTLDNTPDTPHEPN